MKRLKQKGFFLLLLGLLFVLFSATTVLALSSGISVTQGDNEPIVDYFDSDSGLWEYFGSAYRNTSEGNVVLTPASDWLVGGIWLNKQIAPPFNAKFRFKAGGGTDEGADGLVFSFLKDTDYSPAYGGHLGFNDEGLFNEGYGLEFDNFLNTYDPSERHIAIIKDSVKNHLVYINTDMAEDNNWHQAEVIVTHNSILVYVDGNLEINYQGVLDTSYAGMGFSASTGAYNNLHQIDDFQITTQVQAEADYAYTISNGRATVTNYTGPGGEVTIPSTLGGFPVTEIGYRAFYENTSLSDITIPEGVTSIGDYAFTGCTNLKTIDIPPGVTWIGISAFVDCSSLESIRLPKGLTRIIDYTFTRCTSLTSVSIPQGVTFIGNYAFWDCSALTDINIPAEVETIGSAFMGCTNLRDITIPKKVTVIGYSAFIDCTHLNSIRFNSPTTIIPDRSTTIPAATKIIGYESSTAKAYAAKYGRTFEAISSISNSPISPFQVNSDSFSIIVADRITGDPIAEAMVDVAGQTVLTNPQGLAVFENVMDGQRYVSVSYQGYRTYECSYNITSDSRTMVVKLEESFSNKPYISTAFMKIGNTQYDILNTKRSFVKVNQTDPSNPVLGELCDITVNVNWKGKTPYKVYISQGGAKYLASETGEFTGIDIGDVFDGGNKPIFIYAKAADGTITELFYTQIQVNDVSYSDWFPHGGVEGLNYKLSKFGGLAFEKYTIPKNFPIFGDTEIGFDLESVPLSVEYEGNKVKVVLGKKIEKDGTGKFKDFSFEEFKKKFKQAAKKQNWTLKELRNYYKMSKPPKLTAAENIKGSVEFMGYAEAIYTEDAGLQFLEGMIEIECEVKYSYEGQMFIGVFPTYYEIGGGVGAGLKGKMTNLIPESGFSPQLEADLKVYLFGEIGGGVGVSGVATAGAEGKAQLNILVRLHDIYQKVDGEGSAKFVVKIFGCKVAEKEFLKGHWLIYETGNPNGMIPNNSRRLIPDYDIYSSIDYDAPVSFESRDYLKNLSQWKGGMPLASMNSPKDTSGTPYTNKEIKILQTNIYPDAMPQIASMDGKKVILWLADNPLRADSNRTMLVYSVYDESNKRWTESQAIMDNGMADYHPMARGEYVVWQKATKVFNDETVSITEIAQHSDLYAAKWNGTGFDTPTRITNNTIIDALPQLAVNESDITVIWTTNTNNDVLGLTGTNLIMQSSYDGTNWSVPVPIADNINAVTNITADYQASNLCIAYVADDDNNLNTINDREVYLIKNGISERITNNTTIDSNPVFAQLDSGTALFWYDNGNIRYRSDINSSSDTTVFAEPKIDLNDRFSVSTNSSDKAVIIWTETENGGAEIFGALLDGTEWSEDIQISHTSAIAKNPQVLMEDDGRLIITFNYTAKAGEDDPTIEGQSDLCTLEVVPSYNLTITGTKYDDRLLMPDTDVPIIVEVQNRGELEVVGLTAIVRNGDGTTNNTLNINETLKPGESKSLSIAYIAPTQVSNQDISIYVTPQTHQDYDETDNTRDITIGYADVNIAKADIYVNEQISTIITTLGNESYIPADNVQLEVREDSEAGQLLYDFNVGSVSGNTNNIISFDVDPTLLLSASNLKQLYVVAISDNEQNTGNNSSYVLLNRSPEILPVSGVEVSPSVALSEGEVYQLTASVLPNDATNKEVIWTVETQDGGNVISLSNEGLITALSPGTVIVRVTSMADEFKYAECIIKVIPEIEIALDNDNKVVTLTFSENIDNDLIFLDELKNAITFATNGTDFFELNENDNVSITDNKLIITFNTELSGFTNKIKIAADTIRYSEGCLLANEVILGPIYDTTAPIVTADPPGGTYDYVQNVSLTATEECNIYYTTDGSDPSEGSSEYLNPIEIRESTVLKFIGVDECGNQSDIYTEVYTIELAELQFDAHRYEVNEEAGSITIELIRGGDLSRQVSVDVIAQAGTAISGEDFIFDNKTITFEPGHISNNLILTIINDENYEPSETLELVLTDPSEGAKLGGISQSVISINENDYLQSIGTVEYLQFEGGFFGIIGDDGSKYRPVKPLRNVESGDIVRFRWIGTEESVSYQMWGKPIRILDIEVIGTVNGPIVDNDSITDNDPIKDNHPQEIVVPDPIIPYGR